MREETEVIKMSYGDKEMRCNGYVSYDDELILLPTYMHNHFSKLVDLVIEYENLRAKFLQRDSRVEEITYSVIIFRLIHEAIFEYEDLINSIKKKNEMNSKQE